MRDYPLVLQTLQDLRKKPKAPVDALAACRKKSPTRSNGGLELKLHLVPTTDSSQVRRVQLQVLELGRGVLELKLHEEENKYTEA